MPKKSIRKKSKKTTKKISKKTVKPSVEVKKTRTSQNLMINQKFKIQISNFKIPCQMEQKCKKCGNNIIIDFSKEGLWYPDINDEFIHHIVCKECGARSKINLKINISMIRYND